MFFRKQHIFLHEVLSQVTWLGCCASEGFLLGMAGQAHHSPQLPQDSEKEQEGRPRCGDTRRYCNGGISCTRGLGSVASVWRRVLNIVPLIV